MALGALFALIPHRRAAVVVSPVKDPLPETQPETA
jgi:hypothetical protein